MNAPRAIDTADDGTTPSQRQQPEDRSRQPSAPTLDAQFRKHFAAQAQNFVLEVEFQAAPGFTILFGPSGAGKTTLLDCVAGLTQPDSGRIALAGRTLFNAVQNINLPVAKRRVGYVFQTLALFPHLTVEQNVQYGLAHLPTAERTAQASAILQAFRIPPPPRPTPKKFSGEKPHRTPLPGPLEPDPRGPLLANPLAGPDAAT